MPPASPSGDDHTGGSRDVPLRVDRDDGPAPPEPAATILVLRGGTDGTEVFMLERHVESDFAGGALVFPGGKVDDADRSLPADRYVRFDPDEAAGRLRTTPRRALGFHVAAVREAFEEAGVLLARRGGEPVDPAALDTTSVSEARRRLHDRDDELVLARWLAAEGLALDLGALGYWSWWVTPERSHRRYDTRFFVARLPDGQAGRLSHDDVETTSSRWITPGDALAAGEDERATVVYPTRKNLEALAEHGSAEAAWRAAAEGRTDTRRIQPRVEIDGDRILIHHPDGGEPEVLG